MEFVILLVCGCTSELKQVKGSQNAMDDSLSSILHLLSALSMLEESILY